MGCHLAGRCRAAMRPPELRRGQVWRIDLNPTRGHEQAGVRPAVIISTDLFNQGPAGLVVVLPLTTTPRRIPLHVQVDPPEGGLQRRSFVKCDDVRSASVDRLLDLWGNLSATTMR